MARSVAVGQPVMIGNVQGVVERIVHDGSQVIVRQSGGGTFATAVRNLTILGDAPVQSSGTATATKPQSKRSLRKGSSVVYTDPDTGIEHSATFVRRIKGGAMLIAADLDGDGVAEWEVPESSVQPA